MICETISILRTMVMTEIVKKQHWHRTMVMTEIIKKQHWHIYDMQHFADTFEFMNQINAINNPDSWICRGNEHFWGAPWGKLFRQREIVVSQSMQLSEEQNIIASNKKLKIHETSYAFTWYSTVQSKWLKRNLILNHSNVQNLPVTN